MLEIKNFSKGEWSMCEHSWSDTSIYVGDEPILTLSIYDKATEETQEELETEMNDNAALISIAPQMYNALQSVPILSTYNKAEDFIDAYEKWRGNVKNKIVVKKI